MLLHSIIKKLFNIQIQSYTFSDGKEFNRRNLQICVSRVSLLSSHIIAFLECHGRTISLSFILNSLNIRTFPFTEGLFERFSMQSSCFASSCSQENGRQAINKLLYFVKHWSFIIWIHFVDSRCDTLSETALAVSTLLRALENTT